MSNFSNLNHYILPADLLIKMNDVYIQIGKNDEYIKQLNKSNYLIENTYNDDAKALCALMKLNITPSRQAILLDKDGVARNKEEEALKNIKTVLKEINIDASRYPLNPAQLIEYINLIYGKQRTNYSKNLTKKDAHKTTRALINEIFDEYDLYQSGKKYEQIILIMILYLEVINLEPFTSDNELAGGLLLYYLFARNNLKVFKYQSFFKLLNECYSEFKMLVRNASVSYADGFVQCSDVAKMIYELILKAYEDLALITKQTQYQQQGLKSDNVAQTIYRLPNVFTKDDIRKLNPNVSDATINRILIKMRDEELIMPLGTGRSAKWMKNQEQIDQVDLSKVLGE